MKIVVCIKEVPDTEAEIVPNGNTIDESAVSKWILNPYDEFAVEEAVKLKETGEGVEEVVAVSLGPERVKSAFQTALSMGADRGIHIIADGMRDPAQVAAALAAAIRGDGTPELVFAGTCAIDDNACQVHLRLARILGASAAINVSAFSWNGDGALVSREVGGGAEEELFLPSPAVVAVTRGINKPRYPTLPNIMKAKKKEICRQAVDDLDREGVPEAVQVRAVGKPDESSGGRILEGDSSRTVPELVDLLCNEARVV